MRVILIFFVYVCIVHVCGIHTYGDGDFLKNNFYFAIFISRISEKHFSPKNKNSKFSFFANLGIQKSLFFEALYEKNNKF